MSEEEGSLFRAALYGDADVSLTAMLETGQLKTIHRPIHSSIIIITTYRLASMHTHTFIDKHTQMHIHRHTHAGDMSHTQMHTQVHIDAYTQKPACYRKSHARHSNIHTTYTITRTPQ